MRYKILTTIFLIVLSTTSAYAQSYYVKNGGDDNADGLSDATAWATIFKVNRHPFNVGDDVYFKVGSRWDRQNIQINWSGTAEDRAVIGAYHMSAGKEVVGVPSGFSKPTLVGDYKNATNIGNSPNQIYLGLITVIKGSYVTIQNFDVKDSSAFGITIGGGGNVHNIIENNEVDHTVGASYFFYSGSDYVIVRNNVASRCNWSKADGIMPYHNHPPCMGLQGSNYGLIENNSLHDLYGEGIDLLQNANFNIVRENLIAHANNPHIYIDNAANNIIENNIILGKGVYNDFGVGPGIASTVESQPAKMYSNSNNIIRNNIIAGVSHCIFADIWKEPIAAGKTSSGKIIGNTCVNSNYGVYFTESSSKFLNWEIANNIFWDINKDIDGCAIPKDPDITLHHNSWPMAPSNVDCNGEGDVNGDPKLRAELDEIRAFSYINKPTVNDFEPQPGSIAEDAGNAMAYAAFNTADFPMVNESASVFDMSLLELDHLYSVRHVVTPDMGAVEVGSTPQPPSNESLLPFYMNVGDTGQLVLGKTYRKEDYSNFDEPWNVYTNLSLTPISGTTDDAVYQSSRGCDCVMTWDFPIENGTYDTTLLFSEAYWGDEAGTCLGGERRFDITIEGRLEEDEYDICSVGGGANTAIRYTKRSVTVTDGVLSIALNPGTTGNLDNKPEIAGIEIDIAVPLEKPSPPLGFSLTVKNLPQS